MDVVGILHDPQRGNIQSEEDHFQLVFRLFARGVSGKPLPIITPPQPPTPPHLYYCLKSPKSYNYCISHSCALLWHLLMYCK